MLKAVLVISLPQEYKLAGAAVATALSQVVGGGVLLLSSLWGITGIWISIIVAEFMAVLLSALFLVIKRKKYHYWDR